MVRWCERSTTRILEKDAPWARDRRYALALVVYAYGKSLARHGNLTGPCGPLAFGCSPSYPLPAATVGLAEVP